jgi:predicted nuclease of predicted toxin-antitoxin system
MNLLADEGVDRQIVERLRQEGYSVLYIAEMDPGISDDLVLDKANQVEALLLTADKDFGELVFRQQVKGAINIPRSHSLKVWAGPCLTEITR